MNHGVLVFLLIGFGLASARVVWHRYDEQAAFSYAMGWALGGLATFLLMADKMK